MEKSSCTTNFGANQNPLLSSKSSNYHQPISTQSCILYRNKSFDLQGKSKWLVSICNKPGL